MVLARKKIPRGLRDKSLGLRDKSLIINAMTVDVEDYFQVGAFEDIISPDDWDSFPCHIEKNIDRILMLFDDCNIKATFFTLGWIAKRYPGVLKRIIKGGHELASHGYGHLRASNQTPDIFLEDICSSKKILEDISGTKILGYRAPCFSIGEGNLWAFDALLEAGYIYSSSVYPIKHDHYGMPNAPRFSFNPIEGNDFLEIPVTTVMAFGKKIPCGGGGFFRLLPYVLSRYAMKKVNNQDKRPCVFYFHPWEIDETQPFMRKATLKSKFRHYVNIQQMQHKIQRLLIDFNWASMADVFLDKGDEEACQ